jgi:hypothetical protein
VVGLGGAGWGFGWAGVDCYMSCFTQCILALLMHRMGLDWGYICMILGYDMTTMHELFRVLFKDKYVDLILHPNKMYHHSLTFQVQYMQAFSPILSFTVIEFGPLSIDHDHHRHPSATTIHPQPPMQRH